MKTVTLRELLRWAFVEELARGGGADGIASPHSAWRAMEQVRQLGVRISVAAGSDPAPMEFVERFDPHPDALLVGQAVREAAKRTGCDLAPIIAFGMLGKRDPWPEEPRRVPVTANGRQVMVIDRTETINGRDYVTEQVVEYDRARRRWPVGARPAMKWDVDPEVVIERMSRAMRLDNALLMVRVDVALHPMQAHRLAEAEACEWISPILAPFAKTA